MRLVFAPRECDFCGGSFVPRVANQRFCCIAHQVAARRPEERRLYHNRVHRGLRRRWAPLVAGGGVVCTGPNGCGELIVPGEAWDLGHLPDGNQVPQHARCNRKTAGRRTEAARVW
jgi:hypothetical protein